MTRKPQSSDGYTTDQHDLVRQTCLTIAVHLGDILEQIVIVGGLVPSLIIEQSALAAPVEPHVGTLDLDLGLSIALFEEDQYKEVAERLRNAGFGPDNNANGRPTP